MVGPREGIGCTPRLAYVVRLTSLASTPLEEEQTKTSSSGRTPRDGFERHAAEVLLCRYHAKKLRWFAPELPKRKFSIHGLVHAAEPSRTRSNKLYPASSSNCRAEARSSPAARQLYRREHRRGWRHPGNNRCGDDGDGNTERPEFPLQLGVRASRSSSARSNATAFGTGSSRSR